MEIGVSLANGMRLPTRREFGLLTLGGAAAGLVKVTAPRAAAPDKIHIGFLPLASHAPTFIAMEKGYFTNAGFDAELVSFEAAEPMAVAIAAGDVDFGVTAITGALIALANKGVVKIIGGALEEEPGVEGEKILVSKKAHDEGVTTPAQLKGRSFGITTAGSSFQYMAHKIAQKEGFPDAAIELKALQKVPVVVAALKSGQIDAWSIQPNIADTLTQSGDAFEIGKISNYIPHYQVTTVFTSTANIDKRRELVTRYLAAYAKGVADYNAALVERGDRRDDPQIPLHGDADREGRSDDPRRGDAHRARRPPQPEERQGPARVVPGGKDGAGRRDNGEACRYRLCRDRLGGFRASHH
jgi:NitT/TauT family transport system substrate-binding protein